MILDRNENKDVAVLLGAGSMGMAILRRVAAQKAMNAAVMDATWGKSRAFQALRREEQNLVLAFINTFGVGCYRQWVADGKKVPLERVIELSGTLMCGGLERFFKTKKEK